MRKPRERSIYNYQTSLAASVFKKKASAGRAYKIFQSGLTSDQLEEAALNDLNVIQTAIKIGLDLRPDKIELFNKWKAERMSVDSNSHPKLRIKTHQRAKKALFDCADKLVEIGDSVLIVIKSANVGTTTIYRSTFAEKVDASLKRLCGIDLQTLSSTSLLENPNSGEFVASKKRKFMESTSKIKRLMLMESLLECYKRDCKDSSAKNIPWIKIQVVGWPEKVHPPSAVHLLPTNQIKKIFKLAISGRIIFSKKPSS